MSLEVTQAPPVHSCVSQAPPADFLHPWAKLPAPNPVFGVPEVTQILPTDFFCVPGPNSEFGVPGSHCIYPRTFLCPSRSSSRFFVSPGKLLAPNPSFGVPGSHPSSPRRFFVSPGKTLHQILSLVSLEAAQAPPGDSCVSQAPPADFLCLQTNSLHQI